MRTPRVLPAIVGAALLAACGGDSNGPSNTAPRAAFTANCTSLACQFTNQSSDADGTISSYAWSFGDGATATTADASHTFGSAAAYDVTLTVTDNGGASKSVTRTITVTDQANTAPTADFTFTCADLTCDFTDQSFDSDLNGSIAAYAWDFGDGKFSASRNPSHTYAAAGTYNVKLIVTDNFTASDDFTQSVTVTAPASGAPTAKFDVTCASLDCTVTDQSTDVGVGTITAWAWDFGDGATSNVQAPPAHHYSVTTVTNFDVKLTVTDNDGFTSSATKQINVAPPAALTCSGVDCSLHLDLPSTVVVTLTSSSCVAHGNQFIITAPIVDTLFTDGCYSPVNTSFPLTGPGVGGAFNAGTDLQAIVVSGISGTLNLVTDPALQVTGDFASGWTLTFDDGAGGPGEPDFNDLIITVVATPVP
jgi:PKD repeat protein